MVSQVQSGLCVCVCMVCFVFITGQNLRAKSFNSFCQGVGYITFSHSCLCLHRRMTGPNPRPTIYKRMSLTTILAECPGFSLQVPDGSGRVNSTAGTSLLGLRSPMVITLNFCRSGIVASMQWLWLILVL